MRRGGKGENSLLYTGSLGKDNNSCLQQETLRFATQSSTVWGDKEKREVPYTGGRGINDYTPPGVFDVLAH